MLVGPNIDVNILIFWVCGIDTGQAIVFGQSFDRCGNISLPHTISVAPDELLYTRLLLGFWEIDNDLGWVLEEPYSFFFGERIVDNIWIVRGCLCRPLAIGQSVKKSHLGKDKDGVRRGGIRRDNVGDTVDEVNGGGGKKNAFELGLIGADVRCRNRSISKESEAEGDI